MKFSSITLRKGSNIGAGQLSEEIQRLLQQCQLTHSEDIEQMPLLGV